MTKWIRADHAQAEQKAAVKAAVAAEREAVAYEICELEEHDAAQNDWTDGAWLAKRIASAIRARAGTDARAALDAMLAKARAEALREAAWLADHYILSPAAYGEYNSGESHAACEIERQILALISADQKEDQ